jgi:hypothetical protein
MTVFKSQVRAQRVREEHGIDFESRTAHYPWGKGVQNEIRLNSGEIGKSRDLLLLLIVRGSQG